ncbi:ThiJ/PfpI family protein [Stachybotrys elegans]|uniref:ThiJ/PfpI family protein n=1 Tax=Stachybotrys elegans TaxID=80388 RepID=A0A8K0WY07_9HYPO|nr:ThiJ/PfpI family protein [Stachybotrys elegans]
MSGHVRIGVFIPTMAQTLDTATVDVLGVMSKEYMGVLDSLPAHVAAMAPNVSVFYITSPSVGENIPMTSGMTIKATHFYTDPEVAPGKLDIVLVPGPDPKDQFEKPALDWLKAQSEAEGVDVLSVCTGIYICAAAGIVDGKLVSGPRGLQDDLVKKFPGIQLVGDNHRWVQDGNFWSSGGITNGNDLMAAYARSSRHWPQSIVEIGLAMTDVGDRGQFYKEGKGVFMAGMVWKLLRSWFESFRVKTKEA